MLKVSFEYDPKQYCFLAVVSGWYICCSNWLRSSSCFRNDWFAASILFWCCVFKRSFSAPVCSNETVTRSSCWISKGGFCACSVNIWKGEPSICSGFCCVFSKILYLVPYIFDLERFDDWSSDSVLFSVWLLFIINFIFRRSFRVWINSFAYSWYDAFNNVSEKLGLFLLQRNSFLNMVILKRILCRKINGLFHSVCLSLVNSNSREWWSRKRWGDKSWMYDKQETIFNK